jgi:hypothetical protein
MIVVDLDALVSLLDPDGRGGRRHVDDVAAAIRRLVGHIDAAEVPHLVGDTIRRGEEQGRWSATRTATVRRGQAMLPKALTLPSDTRATAHRLRQPRSGHQAAQTNPPESIRASRTGRRPTVEGGSIFRCGCTIVELVTDGTLINYTTGV